MNILLKAKYSFYSTLVFFLVANPETYKIIQNLFGSFIGTVASSAGCPTPMAAPAESKKKTSLRFSEFSER